MFNCIVSELKKLSFKNLEKMPKITDRFFRDVLQHLQLTHFVITSDEPLIKVKILIVQIQLTGNNDCIRVVLFIQVTKQGIAALATEDSCFSKSIKKFPFKEWEWSLQGESTQSFHELRNMFHCNA